MMSFVALTDEYSVFSTSRAKRYSSALLLSSGVYMLSSMYSSAVEAVGVGSLRKEPRPSRNETSQVSGMSKSRTRARRRMFVGGRGLGSRERLRPSTREISSARLTAWPRRRL